MRRLVLAISLYILGLLYINENNIPLVVNTNSEFKGAIKREINLEYKPLNNVKKKANEVEKERLKKERLKKERERKERERKEKELQKLKELELQKARKRNLEIKVVDVELSFYCSCSICTGEWYHKNPGITASGTKARFGTVAAPKELKFGTQMKIRSFGDKVFTVEDTGSYIKKIENVYRLDIYVSSHSEAMRRGRYRDKAEIIN